MPRRFDGDPSDQNARTGTYCVNNEICDPCVTAGDPKLCSLDGAGKSDQVNCLMGMAKLISQAKCQTGDDESREVLNAM